MLFSNMKIFICYNLVMSKIRKLYYFDKKNMREMISFLNNNDAYINHIMFNPLLPLHHLLPIRFKFLPESYVLKDKKDIKGLITIAPTRNPLKRLEIQRLFFEENSFNDAYELIQFAVSKYKAKGAISFLTRVDDNLPDLIRIFVSKCDFSKISYEKLWKIPRKENKHCYNKNDFRKFKNSDSQTVSTLYNESLLPHFRPLLGADKKNFKDVIFKGLSYFTEYKYIMEDKKTRNISAYISIKTTDNKNYVLDVIQSSWVEINLDMIIDFAFSQIEKRQKDFNLLFKTKRYTQYGDKHEQFMITHKLECVQTQVVLTNSSAKIIKDDVKTGRFVMLNQFLDSSSVNVPG